jgi:hypothetical protein
MSNTFSDPSSFIVEIVNETQGGGAGNGKLFTAEGVQDQVWFPGNPKNLRDAPAKSFTS